jgi:hypothetical protein
VRLTLITADTLAPHDVTLQAANVSLNFDTDAGAGPKAAVDFAPIGTGRDVRLRGRNLPLMKIHGKRGMEGTPEVLPPSADQGT